jgi:dihydrofolate synthase/folylpolyglutamate synthase
MCAALLEAHGLCTGAFLSPHLTSFAERVRIGDEDLTPSEFAAAIDRVARAAEMVDRTLEEGDQVTQFEALTAAAYDEFARRGVEVAVVEAGLGGRWDATNVLDAGVCVLTNVGLEHTRWLGPTITDIAREKLAVVAPEAALVLGDDQPEVVALARATGARIVRPEPVDVPLPGYQRTNFAVACAAAREHLGVLDPVVAERVAARITVPGRLQVVAERPLTILDGAHNPSGVEALAAALPEREWVGVVSILDDKDAAAMLRALLPRCTRFVCTAAPSPRALSPATLASLVEQLGATAEIVPAPRAAVARAQELAGPDGAVIATGSIYLIAELVSEPGRRRASAL